MTATREQMQSAIATVKRDSPGLAKQAFWLAVAKRLGITGAAAIEQAAALGLLREAVAQVPVTQVVPSAPTPHPPVAVAEVASLRADIADLRAAVESLRAELRKRDRAALKEAAAEVVPFHARPKPVRLLTDAAILSASTAFAVPPDLILGSSYLARAVQARFAAALVMRESGYSYPQIGTALHRDHTSIIRACQRAVELCATDSLFAARVGLMREATKAAA